MDNYKIIKNLIYCLIFINCYLVINIFRGENNIFKYFEYQKKNTELQLKIDETIKARHHYMKLKELLSKDNIDVDTLDEIVRQLLQVSRPDEKIVLLDDLNRKHILRNK